jgi:hypothetical protein
MADLKIYNNGENKILFSAGDRIIRQPYETRYAHDITPSNPGFASNYIRCKSPIDNIASGFSVVLYVNYFGGSNIGGNFAFGSSSYQNALGVYRDANPGATGTLTYNKSTFNDFGTNYLRGLGGIGFGKNVMGFNFSLSKIDVYKGGYSNFHTTNVTAIPFSDEVYEFLYLGISAHPQYSFELTNSAIRINRVIVYDRLLTLSEYYYMYSNGLMSNPQSTEGVVLDINFADKGEILDFSTLQDGSDLRVGIRDYSGFNRHGEIMNLPAGTLQEQLDWANANLFVLFIS